MSFRDTVRYVYDGLRRGYDDPYWWRGRFLDFVVSPVHTSVYPRRTGAVDVPAADWDTLILLDACRLDLFEERVDTDRFDEYRSVTSRGSTTREWVRQNFAGRQFGDTVYVTANPYVSREAGDAFHQLVEPWIDDFDDELNTVWPETVVEAAVDAHERYPDKRVIAHFMQPHHPFVGSPDLQFDGWQIERFEDWEDDAGGRRGPHTPWDALYRGLATREAVWEAYGDNLDVAMDALDPLLEAADGRVVITSDHGNMLGERTFPVPLRVYGHPQGIRNRELVEVPWAVIDRGERREVTDGAVGSATESEREAIEDRLEDLGYV
jgi:hypothetical protein